MLMMLAMPFNSSMAMIGKDVNLKFAKTDMQAWVHQVVAALVEEVSADVEAASNKAVTAAAAALVVAEDLQVAVAVTVAVEAIKVVLRVVVTEAAADTNRAAVDKVRLHLIPSLTTQSAEASVALSSMFEMWVALTSRGSTQN